MLCFNCDVRQKPHPIKRCGITSADGCGLNENEFIPLLDIAAEEKEEEGREGLWDIKLRQTTSGSSRGDVLPSIPSKM